MHQPKGLGQGIKRAVAAVTMLAAATAAMGAAESSESDWQYGLGIYAWLPSISGDLNHPLPGGGDVSVDTEQILDSLKMTFMGNFEARKGDWSGFTDLIYLRLGGDKSKSITLPNDTTHTLLDADMELKGWVWTLGGAYTPWRNQGSYLDLFAGARMLSLETDVDLTGGGPLQAQRELSMSETFWDGIVGAKGHLALNERWFVPYYIDVGTGETDLTWQAAAGIGYAFDWGQATLLYRYLEYDQGSDEVLQDISFGGVQLGVGFRF